MSAQPGNARVIAAYIVAAVIYLAAGSVAEWIVGENLEPRDIGVLVVMAVIGGVGVLTHER